MLRSFVVAFVVVATSAATSYAGWGIKAPKAPKVKSLGKYQQQAAAKGFGAVVGTAAGAASTPFVGPYGGAAVGAGTSHAVGNHAGKKWTGKGLQNWNKPGRW